MKLSNTQKINKIKEILEYTKHYSPNFTYKRIVIKIKEILNEK